MSSGGGSTTTASTGIDPEFKPYLREVLSDVTQRYKADVAAGPGAVVAEFDPLQEQALQAQAELARQAMSGTGIYDTEDEITRMLQNVAGAQEGAASASGALGSSRAERAQQAALADMAADIAASRQQQAQAGVAALGEAGTSYQAQRQSMLDAPHTSASRYFGYLGSAPQQQTQTSSGGGK